MKTPRSIRKSTTFCEIIEFATMKKSRWLEKNPWTFDMSEVAGCRLRCCWPGEMPP